jgi:hypothetical protein
VLSSDEEVFGGWRNLGKETDGEHTTTPVRLVACVVAVAWLLFAWLVGVVVGAVCAVSLCVCLHCTPNEP